MNFKVRAALLGGGLLLLGGGLMLRKTINKSGTDGVSPLAFNYDAIRELPYFVRRPTRMTLAAWLVEAWQADGTLSVDEMSTLLAIAYRESGYRLDAISGPDAPDAAVGDAHSLFQITGQTATGLGVDIRQLVPWSQTEAEFRRATHANAHAALKFLNQRPRWTRPRTFREAVLSQYAGDPYAVARQYFCSWAGGVGRRWEDIADVPVNNRPGSLGYIHITILHKMEVLNQFRAFLGQPPLGALAGRAITDVEDGAVAGSPLWLHRAVVHAWPLSEAQLVAAAPRADRADFATLA